MAAKRILMVALAAFLITACSEMRDRPNETAGGFLGAIAGGLIGAQFGGGSGAIVTTALGSFLGAWAGSEVGRSMDEDDRRYATQAHEQAFVSGQTMRWNNPDSGNHGIVQPGRDGTNTATGAYCREFQTTIVVDGISEQAYGTACRQPDGTWEIQS